ncbi:MAG: ribosome-associated translation inhibitor RaiA [Promicromonosporaceae bacterium]|nr:ribosome-associated translation inhibitor RaiA [Promicromonosporaceae bacterium]
MEIVVTGRHTEVPERFRTHVEEKLAKVTQLAPLAQRIDVEVTEEKNPKLAAQRERVELTVRDKGPVIRAEAAADDRYGALDLAIDKLIEQLRRSRDRRKDHRRTYVMAPMEALAILEVNMPELPPVPAPPAPLVADGAAIEHQLGDSPVTIRQKLHTAEPMTLDDAVYEMEMVGHDFYLFIDSESSRPSVVYKRKGWTYGVVQLDHTVN